MKAIPKELIGNKVQVVTTVGAMPIGSLGEIKDDCWIKVESLTESMYIDTQIIIIIKRVSDLIPPK